MTQPTATAADWQNQPLPERRITLALDFTLDATETASLREGLIPHQMEDKWFIYCVENIVYLHRSWTGICIAVVHFTPDGEGLRAVSADVNREPDQYTGIDDHADIKLIENLLRSIPIEQAYRADMRAREAAWLASRTAGKS